MRTLVSRFLLLALLVVAVAAIVRLASGGRHAGDVVHLERLDPSRLEHVPFEVREGGARLAVWLTGSFEGTGPEADTTLAATGWIVRRADGAVVWRPQTARRPPTGPTLFTRRDTLVLPPGAYDAYFASFGDPLVRAVAPASDGLGDRLRAALSRGGRTWVGEADRWRFVVSGVTPADRDRARRLPGGAHDDRLPGDGVLWTSGPLESRAAREGLLRVGTPSRVALHAVTEVAGAVVADSVTVTDLATGETVWAPDPAAGAWAGGSVKNRTYRDTLALAPGLYRVRAHADRSHAARDWAANPPFAPWQWGVTLAAVSGDAAVLDPEALPVVLALSCVGPSERQEREVALAAPLLVHVTAQGEISDGSRYDYPTLERADTGEVVWEMTRAASERAGGTDRNRRATALLALAPGRYRLRYVTDGSHDCVDGFGGSEPDDPLWGVVLRAASPGYEPAQVSAEAPLRQMRSRDDEAALGRDRAPDDPNARVLVRMDRLGPDVDETASFTLADPAAVRIVALGELLPSGALDHSWITDASGETVWEMRRSNTVAAGGAAKNRRADVQIALEAGTFTVHTRTNDRHDRTGFDGEPPARPDEWGIRVERAPSPDEP